MKVVSIISIIYSVSLMINAILCMMRVRRTLLIFSAGATFGLMIALVVIILHDTSYSHRVVYENEIPLKKDSIELINSFNNN